MHRVPPLALPLGTPTLCMTHGADRPQTRDRVSEHTLHTEPTRGRTKYKGVVLSMYEEPRVERQSSHLTAVHQPSHNNTTHLTDFSQKVDAE